MNPADVPILMYHAIGSADSPWCLSPEKFGQQMGYLHDNGYITISLTQLKKALDENGTLPQKAVVITFDDGRKGIHAQALSILRKYGYTATIYIVPAWLEGQPIPAEETYSEFLNWEELQDLAKAGFEIGSHSFSHQNLTALDQEQVLIQLQQAENLIRQRLGISVHHFSYPFGICNEMVLSLITSRYQTAVTVERGFSRQQGKFSRQWITRDTSSDHFRKLLQKPRLSLAMIVRNEEKNLAACLQSVQGLADEIIIVDTGSTDKTKEIAAQFAAKVSDFHWIDDFAAARNEALKQARGDWILILDADEIVAEEDHAAIIEAINNWDVSGYRVLTRNYTNSLSMSGWQPCSADDLYARAHAGWFPSLKVRLFQRQDAVQFAGRIHEMVDSSIAQQGGMITLLPVPVHHYGEEGRNPAKVQQYLTLSRKKVAENPADAKAYFELGVLYKEAGKVAEAELMFRESLRYDDTRLTPRLNLALVQQKQGKYDAAIENYRLIMARENTVSSEAHFGLGFCYFQQKKLELALTHFQQAVKQNPEFVDAYLNLGAVWEQLGGYRQGVEALKEALALSPGNARAYYNIGVIYEKVGALAQALTAYQKAIELNYKRKEELLPKVAKMKEVLADHHQKPAA